MRTPMRWGPVGAGILLAAGCSDKLDGPDPAVSAVEPNLVCAEQLTTTVTIDGSELSPTVFDSLTEGERAILPQIDLTRSADLQGGAVERAAIRVPDAEEDGLVRWASSTEMSFDVTPELGLEPGVYDITLTNPSEKSDTLARAFGAVPRPVIDEIEPEAMCVAQSEQSFEIRGSGFLSVGGEDPTITIDGEDFAPSAMESCGDLAVPGDDVRSCGVLVVTLPEGAFEPGTYDVVVTNPEPAECASSDQAQIEITPPPEVEQAAPLSLCRGGGTLSIQGQHFTESSTVFLDEIEAANVDFVSDTELTAQFGALGASGPKTLTVHSGDGCYGELETQIEVVDGIIVFFADPPVVFSGINTQITVYVSGLDQEPTRVALFSPEGEEIDLSGSIRFEENRPGRTQVVVPSGLDAGEYDVAVEDGTGCETLLPGGLTVTDELTLALREIDPPFAGEGIATGVELRAADDDDVDEGEVQFVRTPRAYLNPVDEGVARELGSVAFQSPRRLSGIVPDDTPAGEYDVIVVNPSGEVGLLEAAFTVTEEPPPVVDLVSPGTLNSGAAEETTIFGSNFRDPDVSFTCRLPDEQIVDLEEEVVVSETRSDLEPEEIDVIADTSSLLQGTICLVRVTNSDGTFFEFSAINIANPESAENALAFTDGAPLVTPRRFPAATGGRAGVADRFVYAIGGDDGDIQNAFDTVEASSVGRFGDLSEWFELPIRLPTARTFARAVTVNDDFIYLVGGFDADAGATTASTLRAKVLDPADRPSLDDLTLQLDEDGIDPGVWFYRLSVVVDVGSSQDPGGGELLASDPLVVEIPELEEVDEEPQVVLLWNEVPEAVEYRLYRTPEPDLASGDELLIATLDPSDPDFEPRFVDDGVEVLPEAIAPLPLGSTGEWHDVGTLNVERQAHGLTFAREPNEVDDPDILGGTVHLYAIGGEDNEPADLSSVERLSVLIADDGNQIVSPDGWQEEAGLETDPLEGEAAARRNLEALTANSFTASSTGDRTFLYAVGGTSGSQATDLVQAIEVRAGGALGDEEDPQWASGLINGIPGMSQTRAGHAGALANNHLYAVGGASNATANRGRKARIEDPPATEGWSDLSDLNLTPRAFMGKAIQASFIYLVGGIDPTDGDRVLDTTQQSVLGGQP